MPTTLRTAVCIILLGLHSVSVAAFDIIAHRGASGYLPEHTLPAAALAHAQRPDFIEQDVVISKDNVPIVLHDIHLETVTNVETVFPQRAREDGRFYVRDFSLSELRQLQVHERTRQNGQQVFPERYTGHVANYRIATLVEHMELISELNRQLNTNIGFYTEIKAPAWHRKEGVDISQIVLDTFRKHKPGADNASVYIQCFDFAEIKRIRNELAYSGTLILLVGDNDWPDVRNDVNWLLSPDGLKAVAAVADGLGPWIPQLFDQQALRAGELKARPWVKDARQAKLLIHPYTFRADAPPVGMTADQVLPALIDVIEADGVFTDQVPPVRQFLQQ
ncbi:glycerophosphodiester phosphodiesterase [Alteromonas sp. ASW11-19]|uniref:glycerophosphodiester phosphodiesterase n=1 Tax=Alteromonas salexigens TaxID=2982530 RepID=A0ABT2VRU2_9ALTE|nr:glycerophosphodiester phosphodiesterase [Alteromonas salexigens]MCU7555133.1 glycerophosphodiester phosphodiesterase [Alteromonas salexigens]